MPSIALQVASQDATSRAINPLPGILQTPAGLAILEIQGTINLPPASPSASTTPIGRLVLPDFSVNTTDMSWMRRVHLYVGQHQRLTGEVKKLPKAIAVIRKRETEPTQEEELEIAEVVYYKIVFSSRPEPVGT